MYVRFSLARLDSFALTYDVSRELCFLVPAGSGEGWETDQLRNHAGFSWSYQNCLGLSLDFLGPIGFVAANLAANWPQAALVKRDVNPAKTDL